MPQNRQIISLKPPFRGLMSGNNPGYDPHFFTKANNVYFDKSGIPVKRPGVTKLSDPPIHNPLCPLIFDATNKVIFANQSWDNFAAGQKINVTGTVSNDGIYNIKDVGIQVSEDFAATNLSENYSTYGLFRNLIYCGNDTFLCISERDGDWVIDEPFGYSVGHSIFKSIDNCVTWTKIEEPFEGFLCDEDHYMWYLYHVGDGICLLSYYDSDNSLSYIYRSDDYGETWALVKELENGYDYFAVATNAGNGVIYAATYYGTIYKSIDYGINWTQVYDEAGVYFIFDIAFLGNVAGEDIILAAGTGNDDQGVIIRTDDSGDTWSLKDFWPDSDIYSLCDLGSGTVIASIEIWESLPIVHKILRSTDYGVNWSESEIDFSMFRMLHMGDNIIIGDNENIAKSTNDGYAWTESYVLNEPFIGSLVKINDTTVYCTSSYYVGDVFKTEDTGVTWEHVNPPFKFNLDDLEIYDLIDLGNDVYLMAVEFSSVGRILRSTDAGATWIDTRTELGTEQALDIRNIWQFADMGNGIIIASATVNNLAVILRSIDNGLTWAVAADDFTLETDYPLMYGICNIGDGIALAGTSYSVDKCYFLRSTDYGAMFYYFEANAEVNRTIWDIISLGSGIVLYIGDAEDESGNITSYIFRSTEYGIEGSFTEVESLIWLEGSEYGEFFEKFYDLGNGIVLATVYGAIEGDYQRIFRSTNYGETWAAISYEAEDPINRLIHLGSGFCIGNGYWDNVILYSDDYGATWNATELAPGTWYPMIDFIDKGNGIVLGATWLQGTIFDLTFFYHALYIKSYESFINETIPEDLSAIVTTPVVYAITPIMGMSEYAKYNDDGTSTKEKLFVLDDLIIKEPYTSNILHIENIIKNGLTRDKIPDFAILSNKIYIANGADTLQVYDGTTCEDIDRPPQSGLTGNFTPSMIEEHRDSLWAAGQPSNPSRLYKSCPYGCSPIGTDPFYDEDWDTNLATFDPESGYALEGAAQIDIGLNDGTSITGIIGNHFGQLIIFKERSIYRIMGATKADFVLPPEGIIKGIGAYQNSIVRAHNNIYFVSEKGIHSLNTVQEFGDNKETYLSFPIQEEFNKINKEKISRCAAIHWPEMNLIMWSFQLTGADNNNIFFVYSYALPEGVNAWSLWTGIEAYPLAIFTSQDIKMLTLGDQLGNFCKFNHSLKNDYGNAITSEIELMVDAGDSFLTKGFRDFIINFNALNSHINVKYEIDNLVWTEAKEIFDNTGVYLDDFELDEDYLCEEGKGFVTRSPINKSAKKILVNIQHNELGRDFSIFNIGIEVVSEGYN